MNIIALGLFALVMLFCIIKSISTIYALFIGVIIFTLYAKLMHFSWKDIGKMLIAKVDVVKHLFIIISMIGVMTAMWRACGTIQTVVCYASRLLSPETFVMMAFVINCAVSFMAGSSFGTAATFGVICMTIGRTLGINPVYLGGAIISGAYFGDRCSPVSSTTIMVAMVTETNLHSNIKRMIKDAFVPFIISSILFLILGMVTDHSGEMTSADIFRDFYTISPIAIIPAVIILGFAVFKIDMKLAIAVSTLSAYVIAIFLQGENPLELANMCLTGYVADSEEVAKMINGGGFSSMIVCLLMSAFAASYAGLFEGTGLLDPLKDLLRRISDKTSIFCANMLCSTGIIMLTCSQTLPLMILSDTIRDLEQNDENAAMDFENSIISIAPLVPWTIASTVPLQSIGVGSKALLFAFYLYVLPIYTLVVSLLKKRIKKVQYEKTHAD